MKRAKGGRNYTGWYMRYIITTYKGYKKDKYIRLSERRDEEKETK